MWASPSHLAQSGVATESVEYLGHVIYLGGLGVQQAKVEAIARIPHPTDVSKVRAFMGLANYYRRYVKGFSAMANPLNMLKLDQEWKWGDEQERAFVELKAKLVVAPILRRPIRVFGNGVGCCTLQVLFVWHIVYPCHRSLAAQVVDGVR